MTYTAWARIPPGRWFEVARAEDEDTCWRLLLAWKPPAGQKFDERTVLLTGRTPASRSR